MTWMLHDPEMKKTLVLAEVIFFSDAKVKQQKPFFFDCCCLTAPSLPGDLILWLMFMTSALCRPRLKGELKKKKKEKERNRNTSLKVWFSLTKQSIIMVSEDDVLHPRALTLLKLNLKMCLFKHSVILKDADAFLLCLYLKKCNKSLLQGKLEKPDL